MAACPLCILGVPEEEHTPERWSSITPEEGEIIKRHWETHGIPFWQDPHYEEEP